MICRLCGNIEFAHRPKERKELGLECRTFRPAERKSGVERVAIVQSCLRDDLLPILEDLIVHLPKRTSERQRAGLRASMNLVDNLMQGNERWLKEQK